MVDPDRARRLIEMLAGYRAQLAELRDMEADRYVAEQALAGRYLVQASAQACIDLANHVIASSGWRAAKDLRDAFTVLEANQVLDPGLAERLRALAGLRNRLVHVYEEVDDTLVYGYLATGLEDLDGFARVIAQLAEHDESGPRAQP